MGSLISFCPLKDFQVVPNHYVAGDESIFQPW